MSGSRLAHPVAHQNRHDVCWIIQEVPGVYERLWHVRGQLLKPMERQFRRVQDTSYVHGDILLEVFDRKLERVVLGHDMGNGR